VFSVRLKAGEILGQVYTEVASGKCLWPRLKHGGGVGRFVLTGLFLFRYSVGAGGLGHCLVFSPHPIQKSCGVVLAPCWKKEI